MYIILTETVDLLLCALYGRDISSITTGIPTLLNAASLVGRGIFIAGSVLSKMLEASVVFYIIGAGISSLMNSTGLVVSGYLTWARLSDLEHEEDIADFTMIPRQPQIENNQKWLRIEQFSPESLVCIQSGTKWLSLRNKFLARKAITRQEAVKFRVKKDGVEGYQLIPIGMNNEEMRDRILDEDRRGWVKIRRRREFNTLWNFILPSGEYEYKGTLSLFNTTKRKFLYIHAGVWVCVGKDMQKDHRFIVWQYIND